MADENAATHAEYGRRIAELNAENTRRRQRANELKRQLAERDELLAARDNELAELRKGHDALKTSHNDLAARLDASPDEWKAKYEEAAGKLREIGHRAVFDKVAREAGVAPEALGDLWRLTGYKAESDEVDEAALARLIGEAVTARPYVLQAATSGQAPGGAAQAPSPPATLSAAAGVSRGAPDTSSGKFRVSRAQAADPAWMRTHYKAVQEASQNGTLETVE